MTWFELVKAAVDSPMLLIAVLALRVAMPVTGEIARSLVAWSKWWQLGLTGHSVEFRRAVFRKRLGVDECEQPDQDVPAIGSASLSDRLAA